MRGVYWKLLVVLIATVCLAQAQQPNQLASASGAAMQEPATGQQGRAAVSTGERTIVGCVAIAAPGPGYRWKTRKLPQPQEPVMHKCRRSLVEIFRCSTRER